MPKPKLHEFAWFDIETVPDEYRISSFGLPPLPVIPEETPCDEMSQSPESLLEGSITGIKQFLVAENPDAEWLSDASLFEVANKNRKGVQDAIKAAHARKHDVANAERDRIKLMSTTPEFCRIVAYSVNLSGSGGGESICDPGNEPGMIQRIWKLIQCAETVVGWHINGFDLPTLFFRSAVHGIDPPVFLDRRRFGSRNVLDLYVRLSEGRNFPSGLKIGSLKTQARLCGLNVYGDELSCGEGSQVYDAYRDGRHKEIAEYVDEDTTALRLVHEFYRGLYWE